MTTRMIAPALLLAAIGLSACGPKTEAGNAAADTVTLNDADATGNADAFEATGNDIALDNGATPIGDNDLLPAEGNGA